MPAATPSRSSVLKLAVLKFPPRVSVPLSRSSDPVEDQLVLPVEVRAMAPPAARRVPALIQFAPLNSKVLPAAEAMAVPEKVPPTPILMSPD